MGLFSSSTKVYTSKSSIKIFDENTDDVVQKAKTRAILKHLQAIYDSYYKCWASEMFITKGQFIAYYRWAKLGQDTGGTAGYYVGLPDFTVYGVNYDEAAIATALTTNLGGGPYTVLDIDEGEINIEQFWQYELQKAPYFYQPFVNQLTYNGKPDWTVTSIIHFTDDEFPSLNEYRMFVERQDKDVLFWIEGPTELREGESAEYTIFSNVLMPKGATVDINITYTGTAAGARYTGPATVVMPELSNEVSFTLTAVEDIVDDVAGTVIMTLSSMVDNVPTFLSVLPWTGNNVVTVTLLDNDTLTLGTTGQRISEQDLTTITVPVVLSDNTTARLIQTDIFTEGVDYNNPGPDNQITLSVDPETDALLEILFDGVVNSAWTRVGTVVTFTANIPPGTLEIQAKTSTFGFDVDATLVNGTAIYGTDFTSAAGTVTTLSFAGTAGESQDLVIDWVGDVPDGSIKAFQVNLSNCEDGSVELLADTTVHVFPTVITKPAVTGNPVDNNGGNFIDLGNNTGINFGNRFLLVQYHEDIHPATRWYWWLYDVETNPNGYTGIAATYDEQTIPDMYPAAIIRRQKAFVDTDKNLPAYTSAKGLLNRVQMNIDDTIENIKEQDGYQDVDDVFLNFAVSPNDTHPLVSKLLFRHFYKIVVDLNLTSNTGEYRTYYVEQDANNESKWYDQELNDDIVGTIPVGYDGVGSYGHRVVTSVKEVRTNYNGDVEEDLIIYQDHLELYFQKTETTYTQLRLRDLTATSKITYGGHTRYQIHGLVTRSYSGSSGWYLPALEDPEDCTIPLHHSLIMDNLDFEEMMTVWQHVFRIDVYSLQVVKTKWYQSGFFKALFTFAAIVITIYTAGAGATLFTILQAVVINSLIVRLVVYIAEETGNAELAVVIGVIASIALADFGAGFEFGTAQALTQSVTNFSGIVGGAFKGIENIEQDKFDEAADEVASLQEQLDKDETYESGVTGEYYRTLIKSVDSMIAQGRDVQYSFDAMVGDSYDRYVKNFHDNLLRSGLV